jgi:transposase
MMSLPSKRKARIAPVGVQFKAWLDKKALSVRPSSAVGRAVTYALSQWDKVMKYIESPHLTPDNNGAENAIRPFVQVGCADSWPALTVYSPDCGN